jgi:hypothetical protein
MRKLLATVSGVAGTLALTATQALAVGHDYTPVTSGITDEVGTALTAGLPIAGTIMGILVGFKFVRRLVKA